HYPEALSEIVWRLLSKSKANRFASARDVQIAIEEFLVSSHIRCTSVEVSEYLDELLPGKREQLEAETAAPLPVEVTDPTVPMHVSKDGQVMIGAEDPNAPRRPTPTDASGPMFRGDLSQPLEEVDDVGRNLGGGGGGGMKYVVILLIAGVAFGFYYLRSHMKPEVPAAAAAPVSKPPEASKPAEAKPGEPAPPVKPAETTKPAEAAPAPVAATPSPAAAAPGEAKPAEPKPVVTPLPAPKPEPKAAAKPQPKPHKPPPHHAPKPDAPRALPHLPSPPPPDNGD